jgi:hypothetical protein
MSALLMTIRSAISMMPFLIACRSSPALGSCSRQKMSVMPATAVSDWPTPTVSMMITSKPAPRRPAWPRGSFGHAAQAARRRARPDEGLGALGEQLHARLVAQDGAAGDAGRRVDGQHRHLVALLDEIQPQRLDEGGLAHPGTPEMPTRIDLPVWGSRPSSTLRARCLWSAAGIRSG